MKTIKLLIGLTLIISLLSLYITSDLSKKFDVVTGGAIVDEQTPQPTAPPSKVDINIDGDPFLGPENADITVVEFSDFECPYCGAAVGTHELLIERFKSQDPNWEPAIPYLKKLAEQNKIKLVFRDFPLPPTMHPNAQKAAEAAECANEQGKFWEMHDKLFENQETLNIDNYKLWAKEFGLDETEFNTCLDSGKTADEILKDKTEATRYGVQGTPTFYVNGIEVSGAQPAYVFEELINQES